MQENKKLKIQGGLIGITRRENSKNNFFSNIAYDSEIEKELREISHSQKKETKIHPTYPVKEDNRFSSNVWHCKIAIYRPRGDKHLQYLNKSFI